MSAFREYHTFAFFLSKQKELKIQMSKSGNPRRDTFIFERDPYLSSWLSIHNLVVDKKVNRAQNLCHSSKSITPSSDYGF